jgi:HEPN domain-containing protein
MQPESVQQWLDKAGEDEQVVAIIRAAGGPWSMAAYHVQQAAEKYIKAALVACAVPPPKSHDLVQLIGLMAASTPPPVVTNAAAMTSAYAWLTRYPGAPPIEESHVATAEQDLSEIKQWCLQVIGQ